MIEPQLLSSGERKMKKTSATLPFGGVARNLFPFRSPKQLKSIVGFSHEASAYIFVPFTGTTLG